MNMETGLPLKIHLNEENKLKGLIHLKMKILIIYSPSCYSKHEFLVEHKIIYFEECR